MKELNKSESSTDQFKENATEQERKMWEWWKKPTIHGNDFSGFISLFDVCFKYRNAKGIIATEIEANGIWFCDDFNRPKKVANKEIYKVLDVLRDMGEVEDKISLIGALCTEATFNATEDMHLLGWPIEVVPDFEKLIAKTRDLTQSGKLLSRLESKKEGNVELDTPPVLTGETVHRLYEAVISFPSKYNNYREIPPKLDLDVRPWLKKEFGASDREAHVFGAIIAEHFKL